MNWTVRRLYLIHYGRWWIDLKQYFEVLEKDRPVDNFIDKYRTFEVKDG